MCFFALLGAITWALSEGYYAPLVPLVLAQAFVMHAYLIAFHEAAHGALCPVGFVNGYLGRVTGLFSFMSLTLYRASHHWHHAYIGDVRDEEFWPLNDPTATRGKRRCAAFCELFLAYCGRRSCSCGRSCAWEPRCANLPSGGSSGQNCSRWCWFWVAVGAAVVWFELLPVFVAGYLVPAVIAGNVQSWRKYVEHVGLTGSRAVALTRSVRNPSRTGRLIAWLLFQEPYHDVHHLYPKVPQEALPAVAAAENPLPPELPVFPNYTAALRDLLRGLGDPKFGKAWARRG